MLLYKRVCEFITKFHMDGPVIIFGSYAKGLETKNSDLDLLLVTLSKHAEKLAREYNTK